MLENAFSSDKLGTFEAYGGGTHTFYKSETALGFHLHSESRGGPSCRLQHEISLMGEKIHDSGYGEVLQVQKREVGGRVARGRVIFD